MQAWCDRLDRIDRFELKLNAKNSEYLTTDVTECSSIKINGIAIPELLISKIYREVVRPVAMCGAECWPATQEAETRLSVMETKMLRWTSRFTRMDRIRSDAIWQKFGVAPMADKMHEARLRCRRDLLPQVYFRSKSNNRCLMSVASVGNEMFKGDKPQLVTVPIYSYEKGEDLLDHPRRCSLEMDRLEHMCKRVPDKSINWPMFEAFVFDCMGLMANTTLFKSASDFAEVEALYTEVRHSAEC
ncbi:unnamed protein product [Heligmosomoides polygyrus]|uniref:NR LBD domain-containing protein n=1 Tax=Heligmosomoides polygyrus TaxID=6339 RepID=A0A183F5N3_HELPZ|nr:unnamed protein product [Heligmosomoides polygyrus]